MAEISANPLVPRLLSALLWASAAAGLYLAVFNRILSLLSHRFLKAVVLPGSGLLILGAALFAGYVTGWSGWLVLPGLALAVQLAGELRGQRVRQRLRGAPPVAGGEAPLRLNRPNTTRDLDLLFYQVHRPTWPGERLRVAHLSDLHVNHHLDLDYFQQAVARVNQAQPDLVLITGDFVTESEHASQLPKILGSLQARLGVYGILGNHDYWAGVEIVEQAVSAAGVKLLYGDCQQPVWEGPGKLVLCGCEAPWAPRPLAQPPVPAAQDLLLVLSHTADNVYRYSRAGAAAVFSGHFHAGQFRLPGIGPLVVPSRYGRRFDHGHFVLGETHLFVTAGMGAAEPPFRLYCPPDIFIVDIHGTGTLDHAHANPPAIASGSARRDSD